MTATEKAWRDCAISEHNMARALTRHLQDSACDFITVIDKCECMIHRMISLPGIDDKQRQELCEEAAALHDERLDSELKYCDFCKDEPPTDWHSTAALHRDALACRRHRPCRRLPHGKGGDVITVETKILMLADVIRDGVELNYGSWDTWQCIARLTLATVAPRTFCELDSHASVCAKKAR